MSKRKRKAKPPNQEGPRWVIQDVISIETPNSVTLEYTLALETEDSSKPEAPPVDNPWNRIRELSEAEKEKRDRYGPRPFICASCFQKLAPDNATLCCGSCHLEPQHDLGWLWDRLEYKNFIVFASLLRSKVLERERVIDFGVQMVRKQWEKVRDGA